MLCRSIYGKGPHEEGSWRTGYCTNHSERATVVEQGGRAARQGLAEARRAVTGRARRACARHGACRPCRRCCRSSSWRRPRRRPPGGAAQAASAWGGGCGGRSARPVDRRPPRRTRPRAPTGRCTGGARPCASARTRHRARAPPPPPPRRGARATRRSGSTGCSSCSTMTSTT